ncbi:hypothetical protein L8P05_18690 [Enterobacter cloacae]|uniref:hypothetical protein n=1 Tax=Enterobacter cloacae TaxID=550 RepID=UPI0020036EF6|nr:hypothetical protein [Enterobacter cloacae]MCK7175952.1 hypothetical protein [Enterobacter cloacae]
MSISDTIKAQKYASIAEVAAAQCKIYAEKLEDAPDYASQAEEFAHQAQESAIAAGASSHAAITAASDALASSESAAQSATEAAGAAETVVNAVFNRTLRAPEGETLSELPPASSRQNVVSIFDVTGSPAVKAIGEFAVLDSEGKIPASMIPAVALSEVFVVNSQAAMLALTAQEGDVAKRTDLGYSFILAAEPASTLSNWVQVSDDVLAQLGMSGGAALVGAVDDNSNPTTVQGALNLKASLATLAASNGVTKVSGAVVECSTVALAQALVGLTDGRKVRTYAYNVPVVTDWIFTTAQPESPTFYISAVGGYLKFVGPSTFTAAGLKPGAYTPSDAWFNRNVMQGLLRDARFSTYSVGYPGTYHVLGSVCPLRSDFSTLIEEGVYIVGHYNDSSIPDSDISQSGGLFSFVKYANPDIGDFTLVGTLSNIHLTIDGDVKTVYDASNSKLHNNNCVGFYDVNNCSVKGAGGISGSDHRGICFDGKSVNCHIDLNYISGTSDEPIVMRGDKTKSGHTNTIHVNNISGLTFDGPAKGVVINAAHNYYLDIWLGNYTGTSLQSVLVKNEDSLFTNVSVNYADNLTEVVRHYDSGSVVLDGGNFSNTISLVRRAGTGVVGICRDVIIKNARALDSSLLYAFWAEINPDTFHALRIYDNDFSASTSSIRLYQNRITAGRPSIEDFRNNEMPSGYAPDSGTFNPVLYTPLVRASANILSSEVSTFTYQYTGVYAFLSLQVRNTSSGVLDQLEIDLIGMVQSNSTRTMNTAAGNVTVARSVNTITVTGATSVAFFYAYGHN